MASVDMDDVFSPKAVVASHVHRAAMRAPLEALALFSSVASTFGNVGQANYASANAYLDALALSNRRRGTVGSSLQIPAVRGAGMGAKTFGEEQLDAIGAISLDEFATCLGISLAPAQTAAGQAQAPLVRALLETMVMPALSELSLSLIHI